MKCCSVVLKRWIICHEPDFALDPSLRHSACSLPLRVMSIQPQIAIGRATLTALNLNRPTLVRDRSIWARQGKHPR